VDNFYLAAILKELSPVLLGRSVSRISQSGHLLSFDLRLRDGRILLISLDPSNPGLLLAGDGIRLAEKAALSSGYFISSLRKTLNAARLASLKKNPGDRTVELCFEAFDFAGAPRQNRLLLRLTGRASNAFLLDESDHRLAGYRDTEGALPEIDSGRSLEELRRSLERSDSNLSESEATELFFGRDSIFGPQLRTEFSFRCRTSSVSESLKSLAADLFDKDPIPLIYSSITLNEIGNRLSNGKLELLLSSIELNHASHLRRYEFPSFSEAAEAYHIARQREQAFTSQLRELRQTLERVYKKERGLLAALESDLSRFGDPEQLKRCGDLILANVTTASSDGGVVKLIDYYDPDQAEIELDMLGASNLQQAAARYFERYQKARRALSAIGARIETSTRRISDIEAILKKLNDQPTALTISQIKEDSQRLIGIRLARSKPTTRRDSTLARIGRWFLSSEGYQIVVGRNDRDNDSITFRLARPGDVWLHAADYPGSHVIIRNPDRTPVPQKTLQEAAGVAAHYSQAKKDSKVAVHYTLRKFISKPPRSKPGLVRLSSFKTLMVTPDCSLERIE
jgi:predicted ribosome quality control (RQC) complex YloA/Tae2 family protein